jgi:hypothetical protein
MTATATDPKAKWRQVYADAVIDEITSDQWEQAAQQRELQWRGERQPLAEVAAQYAQMNSHGYNAFKGPMIQKLHDEFPEAGIEATPAREFSVAIYLHVPEDITFEVESFVRDNWEADEVDWVDGSLRVWWD